MILMTRLRLLVFATSAIHLHGWSLSAQDVFSGRGGGSTPTELAEPRPFEARSGPSSILDLSYAEAWCTEQGLLPNHLQKVYG